MSKQLEDWIRLEDPAALFLAIWAFANSDRVQRADLASAISASSEVRGKLAMAMEVNDGRGVVREVCAALSIDWTEQAVPEAIRRRAGLLLAALRALDDAFEAIHPRTPLLGPGMGAATLPQWLVDLREHRLVNGYYARDVINGLIARGPFARNARGPREVSSFSLRDQFSACVVVPLQLEEDGRAISVVVRVIDQSVAKGVPPRPDRAGAEHLTLAPLAERPDDLQAKARQDGDTHYLDITKGPGFNPPATFAQVIAECGPSDVLILPELVVDPDDVAAMRDLLATAASDPPRMVICGSALTPNGVHKPWNQSDIVNASGAPLWSHRKVFAYGMLPETLEDLDIPGADGSAQLLDDISWSNEIVVADIEGLGRCVVLICQDLMMEAVDDLVAKYEPDYVFVPILDSGTNFKRWPFERFTKLNAKGPARFVVVSSLTMQHWRKTAYPGEQIAVAVGPAQISAKDAAADKPRLAREISCEGPTRRHATIAWRDDAWQCITPPSVV